MGPLSGSASLTAEELRKKILNLVEEYAASAHGDHSYRAGFDTVPVSGRVYGAKELCFLVDASLDFWLTTGRFNTLFERRLRDFLGIRYALTTNSGSSANLLAVSALTSGLLKEKALKPGDEVIAAAASFPTTVNPLIQNGLVPVFVDISLPTYNVPADLIEAALTKKTKAVVLAHTLGNPFELGPIMEIVKKHDLWLVEDCCDALGSTYKGRKVGTFGHIASLSFYPAHHITMGEGGAVLTNDVFLKKVIESFRDWGRDCYCMPGKNNTCGKRFDWELGRLPKGYDHKYIYSHVGYNLKITDMQAAVGLAQMDRLEQFIEIRKRNFNYLRDKFTQWQEYFILPEATPDSDPAWFGFLVTLRESARFSRRDLTTYLDKRHVATRLLFAGNITKQPYFQNLHYRISRSLDNTDQVMKNTFWLGVYPKLTIEMLDYVIECIDQFIKGDR